MTDPATPPGATACGLSLGQLDWLRAESARVVAYREGWRDAVIALLGSTAAFDAAMVSLHRARLVEARVRRYVLTVRAGA